MTVVRWILAVVVGFFAYWIVMLMTLGVTAMIFEKNRHMSEDTAAASVGHSQPLVALALGLGSFAAVFLAAAIAPAAQRRLAGGLAVLAAAAWAIYGQFYAHSPTTTFAIQAGAAIVGAIVAYLLANAMFKGRAK